MEKKIFEDDVFYSINWSRPNQCDRHTVMGIPSVAGIVALFQKRNDIIEYLLFYACWKSGVRSGVRDLLDPTFSQFRELITLSENKDLMFNFTVVDTSPQDMQDIMYWLIKEYSPKLNNIKDFLDSERYKNIYLLEKFEGDADDK
ncbi:MAG: hypothetical protein V1874_01630 [Spirochaetota bacterium]